MKSVVYMQNERQRANRNKSMLIYVITGTWDIVFNPNSSDFVVFYIK